jgi:hypothetical protein
MVPAPFALLPRVDRCKNNTLNPDPFPTVHPNVIYAGRLDAEVLSVTRRVGELLQKLPRDINPVNLEELRRIKQTLVELENKVGNH